MSVLRDYELIIGKPWKDITRIRDNYVYSDVKALSESTAFYGLSGYEVGDNPPLINRIVGEGDFIKITQLQIKAKITYSKKGKGNKQQPVKIEIYNPSELTLKYLEEDNVVVLKAGYNTDDNAAANFGVNADVKAYQDAYSYSKDLRLETLAVSSIVKVDIIKNGQDVIAKLDCSDSGHVKKAIYDRAAFPPKTTYKDIFLRVISVYQDNGIPLATNGFDPDRKEVLKQVNKGYTFAGNIDNVLAELCESINYRHYTCLGELFIVPKSDDTVPETVVIVGEDDFKRSVEKLSGGDASKSKSESKSELLGVKLNIFLNGALSSAKFLRIEDGDFKGLYSVTKVEHVLDYEGSPWDTIVECEGLTNVAT